MVPNPRPRGQYVPVDRTPALPGAPRAPRPSVVGQSRLRDGATRNGLNAGAGSVWGSRVAPVTGRKSRRQPGWSSDIAGGQYVETMGQRHAL